ncbi:MAG: protein-glutamate O-methyltransferase CheR [Caulobacter sp.]|nr:protein-glutamate O-methyltransferase CheR [Caulobacter sp.]
MSPQDVELFAALARARAGLRIDPAKTYLIESRLAPLARREGYPGIAELAAALRSQREEKLIWAVVETLARGESAFFRDRLPFETFRKELLPTLARLRGAEPIRVWSCACSTGQEAYSLAMIAEAAEGLPPGARVEIYGSDISERALEKAQAGLYTQFEVQRGLPIRQLLTHFEKVEDNWRLTPRIRQRVRWRRVNLISDLAVMGRFDVIFCRNVLSGMDAPYRRRVLESLAALLPSDGLLILGARETAEAITEAFRPVTGRPGLYVKNPAFRAAA